MADTPTTNEIDPGNDELDQSDLEILDRVDKELEEPEDKTKDKTKTTEEPVITDEGEGDDQETENEDEKALEDSEDKEDETEGTEELPDTKLRPSIKTMMEKTPELKGIFDKHPQLRDAYFREGKYSQIYPTIELAKEAFDKAEALDSFNDYIMAGSSGELLDAISKDSPDALKKFVVDFLPTLGKFNGDLFYEATIPVINTVIRNLHKAGEKSKNQNQMAAAKILSHFLHQSYDIPEEETKVNPEIENERKRLEEEKQEHRSTVAKEFESSVYNRGKTLLSKVIEDGLDPTNSMSKFIRSKIVEDVIERVGEELEKDHQHMSLQSRLWKNATAQRFSKEAADRILTAYLSRAKQLVPEIRKKVKAEALGERKKDTASRRTTTGETVSTGTRSRESSGKISDPKSINWRKQSDLDILNS
jgi:hypothetical protein